MSLRDLLETFDVLEVTPPKAALHVTRDVESGHSSAYEAGYSSGWADAKAANDQAHDRIQAEFERNVETLSFTYHEALDHVRGELKTFVDALLNEFLPGILSSALGEHLRAELLLIAEERLDLPVEIVVSPDCSEIVSELINGDFSAGIELVEDASLAAYQVFVRFTESEKEINLAPLVSELKFQLRAMAETKDEANANG